MQSSPWVAAQLDGTLVGKRIRLNLSSGAFVEDVVKTIRHGMGGGDATGKGARPLVWVTFESLSAGTTVWFGANKSTTDRRPYVVEQDATVDVFL
jgi:hypothetical protein